MTSTDSSSSPESDRTAETVREEIESVLQRNFPQITMHGGEAAITSLDVDEGVVHIQLGGACSGCGISPMTINALQNRLPDRVPEITTVRAETGQSGNRRHTAHSPSTPSDTDSGGSDAPF